MYIPFATRAAIRVDSSSFANCFDQTKVFLFPRRDFAGLDIQGLASDQG